LAAIDKYLAESNPVADHPSCRALKIIRREQQEIVEWGRAALEAVLADDAARQKSAAWAWHLQAYFAAANDIGGTSTKVNTPLPQPRSAQPLPLDLTPQRDLRFHGLFDQSIPAEVVYADESRPIEERNLALLFKRLREMDVPEAIAGILAQMPGKPWAF